MDKKYVRSTLALPEEASEALDKAIQVIKMNLGFTPSRSDAVSILSKYYIDHKEKDDATH
jgi:metal-responsive CopG/Arc/MetJ family transcriptional regulator